ncbi:hypothetical protein A3C23_01185 [Candidatus Roizmanbacteria bacterium RIFCSPHIGHO2_02_FULL_37_13b]|uniref:SpoVT-AbrB domain-containing protein n=1 Tax=Candidatus Roizmanbacteria bacterium RIFCSPLOWO2_02_FULL_36_11 TaxID=1802071 RepID=A0A1F7JHH4_9BACT|nr:MAG: hypothetical protein A3C23_01185 [Candidatus Roizmanbacteria bacterium RIFCSPHIGHO2_02_FULL_37_13b]OGK55046.1 MAG: hypothetical protein A3H78_01050 [Candidatus Roizmanbacteria bacterium RIFCSPLOWO2_02_FULL_36_11]
MELPVNQGEFTKIQAKGLITIPKKFRKALSLEQNQLIKIRQVRGRLLIEPVRTLPYLVRKYTSKEVKDFLSFDQRLTDELKNKKSRLNEDNEEN